MGWYRWEDPYVLPRPELEGMTDYEERREYDEAGCLTGLTAYGVFAEWAESVE